MTYSELTALELFAGGGGMALGTDAAGFKHVALLELNPQAVETLRHNAKLGTGVVPERPIEATDVTAFDYDRIESRVDLLAGGAPCQPFSLGGRHAGQRDRRNLFPEVFRAQRALEPRAVLLENVRGLTRLAFRPYLEYILLQLALPGLKPADDEGWKDHKRRLVAALERGEHGDTPPYDVRLELRECADFGVPQRRSRVFIVAMRADEGGPVGVPDGRYSRESLEYDQHVSGAYWSRHGLPVPERNGKRVPPTRPPTHPWRTVRDALRSLPGPGVNGRTQPGRAGTKQVI